MFLHHGDRPSNVEYHWHGFQLIWGNAYILAGMALLLFVFAIGLRVRNQAPQDPLVPASDPVPASVP